MSTFTLLAPAFVLLGGDASTMYVAPSADYWVTLENPAAQKDQLAAYRSPPQGWNGSGKLSLLVRLEAGTYTIDNDGTGKRLALTSDQSGDYLFESYEIV